MSTFVLEAFVGPCPQGVECCHNDGNCLNNAESNLRWDTSKSNKADQLLHGTRICGERINTAKLTAADVREIRDSGQSAGVLAEKFGVTKTLIYMILGRKVWKHI